MALQSAILEKLPKFFEAYDNQKTGFIDRGKAILVGKKISEAINIPFNEDTVSKMY